MMQSSHVPTRPPTSHTARRDQPGSQAGLQPAAHVGDVAEHGEWNARIADALAAEAGVRMTAEHRNVIAAVRLDFAETGEMPTLLRTSRLTGVDAGRLFVLFHATPALTMGHIAGLRTRGEPTA